MKYIILLLILIFTFDLSAQCGLDKTYIIHDEFNDQADTTNVSILVSGANINNLADPNQGVCGVKLKFRHNFMKEMFIELISPSGQKVTLTGGNINAYFTGLITWDVTFVPNGATAIPDSGFDDIWENDQNWLSLNNYTGIYYPHMGRLENFNTGPVNGTWTLRCIDFADGDEGILLDASLIFCDDVGVTCGECILDPGMILNPDVAYCQGDDRLEIDIVKTFSVQQPIDSIYNYTNVIFNDTSLISYTDAIDLRTFSAGTYTICGIQYADNQSNILPVEGALLNNIQLNTLFFTAGNCAAVSDSCMVVVISNQAAPVNLQQYICEGSSVTIDGVTYDQEGIYDISIANGACDSLVRLDLRVISLEASIMSTSDSLSCLSNLIALEGSNEGDVVSNLTFNWFTFDGQIVTDTTDFIVDIRTVGTYFLEVSGTLQGLTCRDTVSKTIFLDDSNPTIDFQTDTITCKKPEVDIVVISNRPIDSLNWISEDGHLFTLIPNGISTSFPGKYFVTITSDNGCKARDSIIVFEDKFFENPSFVADTLTCRNDSVQVLLMHNENRTYDYSWTDVLPSYISERNPFVSNAGSISVNIIDRQNGCGGTFSFDIQEDKIAPLITSIMVDTISCDSIFVIPLIAVNEPVEKYEWSGLQSMLPNPRISNPGSYTVTVTATDNGCTAVETFEVQADTLIPLVTLMVDSLTCLVDTVIIKVTSDIDLKSAIWTGIDFLSTDIEPMVYTKGLYNMTFIGSNGCIGQTEIFVPNGEDIPQVIYKVDSIRCGSDTLKLVQESSKGNYTYEWEGPNLLEDDVSEPRVLDGGIYKVTITNPNTGCTDEQDILVIDDRIYTTPQVVSEPLDCQKDSVQIRLLNTDIVSVEYRFENGFYSNEQSPFVNKTGTYYYTFINQKNCVTSDSVVIYRNDTLPLLSVETPVIKCEMDSVRVSGLSSLAGTSFTWRGDGYLATGNNVFVYEGGSYTMVGVAPNSCRDSITFTIGYDTLAPVFSILLPDTITCQQNQITLSTNYNQPQSSTLWFPNGITNSSLDITMPGQYIALITAANNCTARDTVNVVERKVFPMFDVTSTVINCRDSLSTIVINPINEFKTVTWRNGNNPQSIPQDILEIDVSQQGTYLFDVINDDQCVTEGSIVVTSDRAAPIIESIISDTINCFNPTVTLGATVDRSVLSYQWQGGGIDTIITSDLTVSESGSYQLIVTADNYCTTDTMINVIKSDDVPEYTLFSDTLTCSKGKINIGVNPISSIISYHWESTDFTSDVRTPIVFKPGEYKVTITGSNGCISVAVLDIIQDISLPVFEIQDTILLPCDTSFISLSVMSDDSLKAYKWIYPSGTTNNSASPQTNEQGDYTIQVTGQNGCVAIDHFYIDIDTRPPGFDVQLDTINCVNPIATLVASSLETDVSYAWESETGTTYTTPTINTSEPGRYTLIVSNANKCRDTLILNLPIDTIKPSIIVELIGDIQCQNRNATLDASSSVQGDEFIALWTTTNGNIVNRVTDYIIEIMDEGTYFFEFLNVNNGCKTLRTEVITESPQQFTEIIADVNPPSCEGIFNGSIILSSLNGTPQYNVVFNGTDVGSTQSFFNLPTGIYDLVITDAYGCVVEDTIVLSEGPDLQIGIDPEVTIQFGDSILLAPEFNIDPTGLASLVWENRDSVLCIGCTELKVSPYINTIYTITYGVGSSCEQTVTILVKVNNDLNNAIPNIFRPTSNGGNNIFYIPQARGFKRINQVAIYDRWAENVFRSTEMIAGDPSIGWDGTFNGKEVVPGVYVLIIEFELSDGQIWNYRGDITVIR